jgi:membrane-bound lytic murein transglycosylase MltF
MGHYWYRERIRDGKLRLEIEDAPEVYVEGDKREDGLEFELAARIARYRGDAGEISLSKRP